MIDELIRKHNLEEQELVKTCDALSDSEKNRLVHMLDRAMESTNGLLTDEKVKFIAETTERLSEVISGLFRKSAAENKKAEERMQAVGESLKAMNAKLETLTTDSKQGDDEIKENLTNNLKEILTQIKELQLKSARRDGIESVTINKTQGQPEETELRIKTQSMFMKWVSDNQFFLLIVIIIIAAQGGNIAKLLGKIIGL